jgi:hypothetical protein
MNHKFQFATATARQDFENLCIWMQENQWKESKAENAAFDILLAIKCVEDAPPAKSEADKREVERWLDGMLLKLDRTQKRVERIRKEGEQLEQLGIKFDQFLSTNNISVLQ